MFNTYINQRSRTEYIPYEKAVTITEKKAPTDESLRLLKEYEEKARASILQTAVIDFNEIKAVVIMYDMNPMFDYIEYHTRFILNGKEYRTIEKMKRDDYMKICVNARYSDIIEHLLIEQFSKAIAKELLRQLPEYATAVLKPRI